MNLSRIYSTLRCSFQGGAPLHYRDIHWFNAPYIFKYCLKMVTPVLSKRILDCTFLYDSLDDAIKVSLAFESSQLESSPDSSQIFGLIYFEISSVRGLPY